MSATANRKTSVAAGSDTVLLSGRGCTSFMVCVPADSTYGVMVHVDSLHTTDEYVPVLPGQSLVFRHTERGITSVVAQGDGGTATNVTYGIVGITAGNQ
jgi:hypothetical protein